MTPPADSQQRILDAARELIYARSYADVGVAEICAQAGVKKGSFYHFYPSKQELTIAVTDAYFADFKEYLLDQAFSQRLKPLNRLKKFIALYIDMHRQIQDEQGRILGCPVGNLAVELSSQDEPIRDKVALTLDKVRRYITTALDEAVADDSIVRIDTAATAQAMLAYVEGVMLMAKNRNDIGVLEQLLPAMLEIRIR